MYNTKMKYLECMMILCLRTIVVNLMRIKVLSTVKVQVSFEDFPHHQSPIHSVFQSFLYEYRPED